MTTFVFAKLWAMGKILTSMLVASSAALVGLMFLQSQVGESQQVVVWRGLVTGVLTIMGTLAAIAYRDITRRIAGVERRQDQRELRAQEEQTLNRREHRQLVSAMMMTSIALHPDKAETISQGMKHLVGE